MSFTLIEEWRESCWMSRLGSIFWKINHEQSRAGTVLLMDALPTHKDPVLLQNMDKLNIAEVAIISGGVTKVLQPADVCYNKTFKQNMRNK